MGSEAPATLNKSHIDKLQTIPDAWILRECDTYKSEMKFCHSVRGRFHQFYIHGKALDCAQWEENFNDCKIWTRDADVDAAKRIIEREKKRIKQRLEGHYTNDIWEKRASPPEEWNKPLPDWFKAKQDSSFLQAYQDEKIAEETSSSSEKKIKDIQASLVNSYPSCAIL